MEVEPTGDWSGLIDSLKGSKDKIQSAVGSATDEIGRMIVATIKGHFQAQDLGWPARKVNTDQRIFNSRIGRVKKSTKKNIMSRLIRLGVSFSASESKGVLAERLAASNQILVDTGNLMNSFTYRKTSATTGQVGAIRTAHCGANLVAVHEFGSMRHNIPARPFFKPTAIQVSPKIRDIYSNAIAGALR